MTDRERRKTKQGVITMIYATQLSSSRKRGHKPPTFNNKNLQDWLLNDWVFDLLWTNWTNCGHIKYMKPSLDRLDDSKGYSFDNIQLMTWGENNAKARVDQQTGKLGNDKPLKAVSQCSLDGKVIKIYISISEAKRITGIHHISHCCNGKRKTAGGYIWV